MVKTCEHGPLTRSDNFGKPGRADVSYGDVRLAVVSRGVVWVWSFEKFANEWPHT